MAGTDVFAFANDAVIRFSNENLEEIPKITKEVDFFFQYVHVYLPLSTIVVTRTQLTNQTNKTAHSAEEEDSD